MIFYNQNGNIRYQRSDQIFGWWLTDFIVDENISNFETINKTRKKHFAELAAYESFEQPPHKILIELHNPKVSIACINSIEHTLISEAQPFCSSPIEPILDFAEWRRLIDFGNRPTTRDIANSNGASATNRMNSSRHKSGILEKSRNKNCAMQVEIDSIRKCFEMDEDKINLLMAESMRLREDIVECNHLDELILLLLGQPEKVKSIRWPFRCLNPASENLII